MLPMVLFSGSMIYVALINLVCSYVLLMMFNFLLIL